MSPKIFIGSSSNNEDSCIECVYEYTLRKNNSQDLDIRWMRQNNDRNSYWANCKTSEWYTPFSRRRLGIAQTGKAFRNEIVARQFIFRMREFEQMEMQFFIPPGTQKEWYEYWKEKRRKWHYNLGLGEGNYRYHDHEKRAH